MAEQGVPIAAELIWGLPGDNLQDFEKNLDQLLATFPKINIFGYTLLPGTEFYKRREEYQIDAIPVSGYGKAKGEYVVGCHTFDRDEGIEGYFLITAHILFNHSYIIPLSLRYLTLEGSIPVSSLLRALLRAIIEAFADDLSELDLSDRMISYENRDRLYLAMLKRFDHCYSVISEAIFDWLQHFNASQELVDSISQILALDKAFCPRYGKRQIIELELEFDGHFVKQQLEAMELPCQQTLNARSRSLRVSVPGGVGDFLKDPDGGSWMRGELIESTEEIVKLIEQ